MIYLDASCLVKLLRPESASQDIRAAVAREPAVLISSLAELEASIQLKAGYLAGDYRAAEWRAYQARLIVLCQRAPFEYRSLSGGVFQTALRQHLHPRVVHCRSLDRLHLAAMEELKVTRLMTHDDAQARAATAMSFEVTRPGRR
ncbi:MAG: PIN domain-containing protein [Limisphaerales bacterium]